MTMKANGIKTAIGKLIGNDTGDPMFIPLGFAPRYIEFFSPDYNYRACWADCIPYQDSVLLRNNSNQPGWTLDVFYPVENGFMIGILSGLLGDGNTLHFQAWG